MQYCSEWLSFLQLDVGAYLCLNSWDEPLIERGVSKLNLLKLYRLHTIDLVATKSVDSFAMRTLRSVLELLAIVYEVFGH